MYLYDPYSIPLLLSYPSKLHDYFLDDTAGEPYPIPNQTTTRFLTFIIRCRCNFGGICWWTMLVDQDIPPTPPPEYDTPAHTYNTDKL